MIPDSAAEGEPVMLSLRVPVALKARLAAVAAEAGVTMQAIGRRAIEVELEVREALLADAAGREAEIRERVRSARAHHGT